MSLDAALNSPEWSIPFLPSCWLLRAECVASLAHLPRVIRGRGWPGSHGYSALVQLWAAGVPSEGSV